MDLFVCVVCVDLLGALGLWLLAAARVEDRKRSRGLVLFFLLVLFVSPDFFEGRTERCCVPMRALEREILLGPPTGHVNKPTPYTSTSYRVGLES